MDVMSYLLSKQYVEDSLAGAGALKGKSAFEIAVENGFAGTPEQWLESLKGSTPKIGSNGTWIIGNQDTGVIASPSLAGYATEEYVKAEIANIKFPIPDLANYVTRGQLSEALLGIKIPDVSNFATKEELAQAIKSIVLPDLSPYATKEFVAQKIAEVQISGGEIDLSAYYTKTEVDTKIQEDLEGYATKTYVNGLINDLEIPDDTSDMIALTHEEILDICK